MWVIEIYWIRETYSTLLTFADQNSYDVIRKNLFSSVGKATTLEINSNVGDHAINCAQIAHVKGYYNEK